MNLKDKKEWINFLAISIIVSLVLFFSYQFIFGDLIKKKEIKVEEINNQKITLEENGTDAEYDIKEIEKRLDELDINIDDIFENLK